jgi:hypothetical protein
MLTTKDVAVVYETLLSSPGMNELIRVDLKVARKNILMLAKMIEVATMEQNLAASPFLSAFDATSLTELSQMSATILEKAGLSDMYVRMNGLISK